MRRRYASQTPYAFLSCFVDISSITIGPQLNWEQHHGLSGWLDSILYNGHDSRSVCIPSFIYTLVSFLLRPIQHRALDTPTRSRTANISQDVLSFQLSAHTMTPEVPILRVDFVFLHTCAGPWARHCIPPQRALRSSLAP